MLNIKGLAKEDKKSVQLDFFRKSLRVTFTRTFFHSNLFPDPNTTCWEYFSLELIQTKVLIDYQNKVLYLTFIRAGLELSKEGISRELGNSLTR